MDMDMDVLYFYNFVLFNLNILLYGSNCIMQLLVGMINIGYLLYIVGSHLS